MSDSAASIEDLCSRNGTIVNGERIDRVRPLCHGDEIRVGSASLEAGRRVAAELASPRPKKAAHVGQRLSVQGPDGGLPVL